MDNRDKILKFVKDEISSKGIPPSIREICSEVGLKSTSSVQYHLNKLEEDGLIKRSKTKSRSINSLETFSNNSFAVPIAGEISAGHPMLAEEYSSGTLNIPNKYKSSNNIFALKVSGDSMIEAGINDGDTVIVKKTNTANNGQIVVALIDDHEAMLKRLRKKGKVVALESANKKYETKIFGPDRVKVQGVLVSLYRNFQ